MPDEVRYHLLRPEQIVKRRKKCPVVYIPIGTLEWHGPHLPTGADSLQAEGFAILCAQKGGGLVFPPLYFGENRVESLMEASSSDRKKIAREMKLSADNFSSDKHPFSPMEQSLNYQKLLIHILAEAESLGFKLAVLVAGHYPLIDHARAAVLQFNKRHYSKYHGLLAWAMLDYLFVKDKYKYTGGHADIWETSHLLHLHPNRVNLKSLPVKKKELVGIHSNKHPKYSSAKFGKETLEASVKIAIKEVKHRLKNINFYKQHGYSLEERIWEKDQK